MPADPQPRQMRHVSTKLRLAAGENISWVDHMPGYTNAQTTWKHYNRFLPDLTRQDGSAFERVIDDPNGNHLVTMTPNLLK